MRTSLSQVLFSGTPSRIQNREFRPQFIFFDSFCCETLAKASPWRDSESPCIQKEPPKQLRCYGGSLVHRAGFEPATPSVGGLCSILLSYRCIAIYSTTFFLFLQYLLIKNIKNSKKFARSYPTPLPFKQNQIAS